MGLAWCVHLRNVSSAYTVPERGQQAKPSQGPAFVHKVPTSPALNIVFAQAVAKLQATLQRECAPLYCVYYTEP